MTITAPAQIRALSSPTRQEIVDVIAAAGPLAIGELARLLGRAADGLYFHVRTLARVGLLVEHDSQRRGRRFAATYDVPFRPLVIQAQPNRAKAVGRVLQSALRLAGRDVERALKRRDVRTVGPSRTLAAGRVKGWLSPPELRRVNALLDEILKILRSARPGPGRTLHSITYASAPVPLSRRAKKPA
jgi:DNA-binding transcriptional ArsR family regulator